MNRNRFEDISNEVNEAREWLETVRSSSFHTDKEVTEARNEYFRLLDEMDAIGAELFA